MKIHYFQRYHSKENVHTSNAMLLLSRLYQYSPSKFFDFIGNILPDNADIQLAFNIQDKISGGTVPDATIGQASFKIAIEAKLDGSFTLNQLQGHLETFKSEDYKVLMTLDPSPIKINVKVKLDKMLAEHNQNKNDHVAHKHLTFEEIFNHVIDVIDDRDRDMQDVLTDYREYCYSSGLIANDWKRMRVQLASATWPINKKLNLYYDNVARGFSGHKFLGLYGDKTVRAIGEIIAIAVIVPIDDELNIEVEHGTITEGMKTQIWEAINDGKNKGYTLHISKHRYFFVEQFYDTDYKKITKGAPMGTRMFDLCEVLGVEKLPDTASIAQELSLKHWQ